MTLPILLATALVAVHKPLPPPKQFPLCKAVASEYTGRANSIPDELKLVGTFAVPEGTHTGWVIRNDLAGNWLLFSILKPKSTIPATLVKLWGTGNCIDREGNTLEWTLAIITAPNTK